MSSDPHDTDKHKDEVGEEYDMTLGSLTDKPAGVGRNAPTQT